MTYDDVLEFWFGELDKHGLADDVHRSQWWKKDPTFDALVRERFTSIYRDARGGNLASWRENARGALAEVIILDQFPRNMFRDSARMFESDDLALARSKELLAREQDAMLATDEKVFACMPFMHSEDMAAQNQCVDTFGRYVAGLKGEAASRVSHNLDFAERHRVIIQRFGRFPHRNALLGRESSEDEIAFLQTKGSAF